MSYGSVSMRLHINYLPLWHFEACKLSHGWDKVEITQYFVPFGFSLRIIQDLCNLTSMYMLRFNYSLLRSLILALEAKLSRTRWSVITNSKLILELVWKLRTSYRLITGTLGLFYVVQKGHQNQFTVPFILSQILTVWHFRRKNKLRLPLSTNLDNPGKDLLVCFVF